jgi:sugar phosphate isomerase/epimerase
MVTFTRRSFLKRTTIGAAVLAAAGKGALRLDANALGLPVGLQLYTVRQELAKDFDGTLKQVADIGYREVEAAGYYNKTAPQFVSSLRAVGLRLPSAHYSMSQLETGLPQQIDFARQLGLAYMICPGPGRPPNRRQSFSGRRHFAMTLDDWKWNAEQFNKIGAETKKAGIQFGYHNHFIEFRHFNGVVLYDQLLRWCDPDLVKFEIDIGWMVYAGFDPIHYMTRYPGRFPELHIKGVKKGYKPSEPHGREFPTAELGRGEIDWKHIFAVAPRAGVKHYYVEQESFPDMPVIAALKVDYEYLHEMPQNV